MNRIEGEKEREGRTEERGHKSATGLLADFLDGYNVVLIRSRLLEGDVPSNILRGLEDTLAGAAEGRRERDEKREEQIEEGLDERARRLSDLRSVVHALLSGEVSEAEQARLSDLVAEARELLGRAEQAGLDLVGDPTLLDQMFPFNASEAA